MCHCKHHPLRVPPAYQDTPRLAGGLSDVVPRPHHPRLLVVHPPQRNGSALRMCRSYQYCHAYQTLAVDVDVHSGSQRATFPHHGLPSGAACTPQNIHDNP